MAMPATPIRTLRLAVATRLMVDGVPLETACTIDLRPSSLTPIGARPQIGLPALIRGGLIQEDGTSRQPQPHEVALSATSIPRTAMARRMAIEPNGLGGRPPAKRPTLARTCADAMSGTRPRRRLATTAVGGGPTTLKIGASMEPLTAVPETAIAVA